MENKFNEGDTVYSKADPSLKLMIRRYIPTIYYCTVQQDPDHKELVYFARELMTEVEKVALSA